MAKSQKLNYSLFITLKLTQFVYRLKFTMTITMKFGRNFIIATVLYYCRP